MTDALEEIKVAEKESERMIEEGGRKKAAIIADAKAKAAQILKEKTGEISADRARSIEKQNERALAAKQKVLDEGETELKAVRKSAEKNVADAVSLVLDAFDKEISS
jgi:vacuolar-type H+-ATPase subunit H